jgi:hypothetical protein
MKIGDRVVLTVMLVNGDADTVEEGTVGTIVDMMEPLGPACQVSIWVDFGSQGTHFIHNYMYLWPAPPPRTRFDWILGGDSERRLRYKEE